MELVRQQEARYVKPRLLRTIKDISDFFSLSRSFLHFFALAQYLSSTVLYGSVVNKFVKFKEVLTFIG